jgi:hypothetical protein
MSLALIEESAKEVRRLAIAGSPLAVGDFRLKKLVAPLEQAGAKVPVFAQVAKAVNEVVNGPEAESAARLLSLSTLLNAILYTQGVSGADGDYRALEVSPTKGASTRTTARVLKPLIQAMTSSGGGRIETIKAAVERGLFNDLRLIAPSIQALGDTYPEIADLVAEKILPNFGPGIIPQLRSAFDLKGKKHDARKLAVMHQLDPAGTVELCKTALADGSPEVRIAAIECLGRHEDCLPLVLEQAEAKNKQVRAAALEALAEHDRPEVTKLFNELIKGKALDILAGPFRALRNRQVLGSLLEEARRAFDAILKGDPEQIPRFCEILDCLAPRKEAEVEKFLLDALAKSDGLAKVKAAQNSAVSGADLMARVALMLYGIGSSKALEVILDKRALLPAAVFPYIFRTALRVWPADKVYSEFSPLLDEKKGAGRDKRNFLESFIHGTYTRFELSTSQSEDVDRGLMPDRQAWDARWLDAAIKTDARAMVCWLARPGHKASLDYLLQRGDYKEVYHASLTVRALARCQHPQATDFFLDQLAQKAKGAKYFDYHLQTLLSAAQFLPKSDLPQLDAFTAKLDEKFVDHFLQAIAPLREVKS